MFNNPFSPIFGGKPGVFFGRSEILKRFELAMMDQGSDDRAFFFTGTRGCGKTALLEQLSIRSRNSKKTVIDLGPVDTVSQLIRELSGFDEKTETVSPRAGVSVLGTGVDISGISVSKTSRIGRESLQPLVLNACSKAKNGLFITVDEIQKIPVEDISALCNAFQMASRKGFDVMLAVAGLPYSYSAVIQHEGCTYLRRSSHEEIGLFTWDETSEAYHTVFSGIRGLRLKDNLIDRLNEASFGHPYLMQLLGYYLVVHVNAGSPKKTHEATEEEVEAAISDALLAYNLRALKPLLEELPDRERKYLAAMSACMGEDRLALTSEVAKRAGLAQNRLSKPRANLINNGVIASPEHGKVMFCIPYLSDYVVKNPGSSKVIDVARQRRV